MPINSKIETPEQRIIYFIDMLKASGVIKFKKEFFDRTGIIRQYYGAVKRGNHRFTSSQIQSICEHYNVNANWIFGVEPNMYRNTVKIKVKK